MNFYRIGPLTCKHSKLLIPSSCETSSSLALKFHRLMCSATPSDNEYTTLPEYPPILDPSAEKNYIRSRDRQLTKIRNVGTVEEKLIGINMPRYYGWSSLILKEGRYPFNFMPFVQHITRTDFVDVDNFPFPRIMTQSDMKNIIDIIRPQLQEAILIETKKRNHFNFDNATSEPLGEIEMNDELSKGVVEQLNRILSAHLVEHAPHIYEAEIDFEPRIEAFWRVGGFYPDNKTYEERKKAKEKYEKEFKKNRYAKREIEEEPDDLIGHFIQYSGQPLLQLRHSKPLKPLDAKMATSQVFTSEAVDSNYSESLKNNLPKTEPDLSKVPVIRHDPGFYGLEKIRRHGTNIPGFWPGDPNEFGLLSYHSRNHLLGRPPSFGEDDHTHTLHSQAMLASYAWLLAQANYQGFSTFHELTYPLTTTTIITDGRVFSFYATQLNTLLLHDEFIDINPKVNVCYGLPSCELYQKIVGDEFVGWNDKALWFLMDAYLNSPATREGVDLKPYLDKKSTLG